MKKFKIIAYILLITITLLIGATIFVKANEDEEKSQRQKALTEIKYLDAKLEDLFNEMNNITMRNYKVYTSNIEQTKKGASNAASENSSSSDSGNSKSSNQTTSNEQGKSNQSNEDEKNLKNYTMQQKGVLTNTDVIDWDKVKNEVELIYTSIPAITLDLYALNINQDEILNFNRQFDNLTVLVKNQNKEETLRELAKMYQYIPKFANTIIDDVIYKTVLNVKSNIFLAYSKLDSKNWNEISDDVKNAINIFSKLLNANVINMNNQTTINKVYVMLNELQNATNVKDEAVFLIKYKNLLEEINNM